LPRRLLTCPVRLNNRIRGLLDSAIGALTLMAKDPARRLGAAEAVYKSRSEAALPALEQALAAETDAQTKRVMTEARAAILIGKAEATLEDRIAAVQVMRDRADQEALALLNALPADAPSELKSAANAAIGAIETKLQMLAYVQNVYLPCPGAVSVLRAGPVRLVAGNRRSRRLCCRRAGRHRHRARHHPLSLRASAGNAARHLGSQPHPPAARTHDIRRLESRGPADRAT
jgi:hypothetical protein